MKTTQEQTLTALDSARFDERYLQVFAERSNSSETRRSYSRVAREFFQYFKWQDPRLITSEQIREWRDKLKTSRKKASTVSFKLAVVRSLFEYLKEEGLVSSNPATTHRVPPPAVAEDLRGRALSVKEVQRLLLGPDRMRVDGARDYCLLLLLVRTGMRISEACSLKRSAITWSHGRWLLKFKVKGGGKGRSPCPRRLRQPLMNI
ncbi:MAG TPA: tyrosine-type recombinase/integrase [Blastocatellia bacterium]|nr:tyrosine-type recombinase/integrase [Blastocatellia bacterium]